LSNLETTDDKLLQIVLVGQPELDEKLDSLGLRQLKQRIALRAQLGPLDLPETLDYISQRLQIAGADAHRRPIFPEETVEAIFQHSQGLPRLINTLCENSLIAAYARQLPVVTPDLVEDVAREFRLDIPYTTGPAANGKSGELDVRQAASALLDLFAAVRRPPVFESEPELSIVEEVSEDEPYI
jgi:general secretion pathway protein A